MEKEKPSDAAAWLQLYCVWLTLTSTEAAADMADEGLVAYKRRFNTRPGQQ